ncbi:hypothetical protein PR048_018883 [Dryococelus australis]|uniref:Uncharacterized protein n=1 Tax=Dryococelus australis TaxID=614101 RepID=A0ABQ9H204_9NEOP|nr:hypothetical protein PR048_018883 [Dryococelus australis]
MPFAGQRPVSYYPAGSPANRESLVGRSSQSDTRLVPKDLRNQTENGDDHFKVTAELFRLGVLISSVALSDVKTSQACQPHTLPLYTWCRRLSSPTAGPLVLPLPVARSSIAQLLISSNSKTAGSDGLSHLNSVGPGHLEGSTHPELGHGGVVVRLLASHLGEPVSIPEGGRLLPDFCIFSGTYSVYAPPLTHALRRGSILTSVGPHRFSRPLHPTPSGEEVDSLLTCLNPFRRRRRKEKPWREGKVYSTAAKGSWAGRRDLATALTVFPVSVSGMGGKEKKKNGGGGMCGYDACELDWIVKRPGAGNGRGCLLRGNSARGAIHSAATTAIATPQRPASPRTNECSAVHNGANRQRWGNTSPVTVNCKCSAHDSKSRLISKRSGYKHCRCVADMLRRHISSGSPDVQTVCNRKETSRCITKEEYKAPHNPVHVVFHTSWRRLVQSLPSTVTADNQCTVDINILVHKTVQYSLQLSGPGEGFSSAFSRCRLLERRGRSLSVMARGDAGAAVQPTPVNTSSAPRRHSSMEMESNKTGGPNPCPSLLLILSTLNRHHNLAFPAAEPLEYFRCDVDLWTRSRNEFLLPPIPRSADFIRSLAPRRGVVGSHPGPSAADLQFACRTANLSASRADLSLATSLQYNHNNNGGNKVVKLLASQLDGPGSIPGGVCLSRIFTCANCVGRYLWWAGFLEDIPFTQPLHSGDAPYSPHVVLIDSQGPDIKRSPNMYWLLIPRCVVVLDWSYILFVCNMSTIVNTTTERIKLCLLAAINTLASHQGEPGLIPDRVTGFSQAGIDTIRWFSRGSPVSPTPSFRRHSIFPSITLICSQDLAVKSRPNFFSYTRRNAKSKYRNRIRLERASQEQSSDTHETTYYRVKRCRERKKYTKASDRVNVDWRTRYNCTSAALEAVYETNANTQEDDNVAVQRVSRTWQMPQVRYVEIKLVLPRRRRKEG